MFVDRFISRRFCVVYFIWFGLTVFLIRPAVWANPSKKIALELHAFSDAEFLRSTQKAFNERDLASAEDLAWTSLKNWPHSYLKPEMLLTLAAIYYENGEVDQADIILTNLRNTVPLYNDDLIATYLKALIARKRGDLQAAQSILLNLKSDQSAYLLALLLEDDGKSFGAISKLSEIIKEYPHSPLVPFTKLALGYSHITLKNYDQAEMWMWDLKKESDRKVRTFAHYLLGVISYLKEDYQQSYERFSVYPDKNYGSLRPYVGLFKGLSAIETGNIDRAKKHLKKNIEGANVSIVRQSTLAMAEVYFKQNNPQQVIPLCEMALGKIKRADIQSEILILRALAYQRMDQVDLAIEDLDRIVDIGHSEWSVKALAIQAQVLWLDHRYRQMATMYQKKFRDYLSQASDKDRVAHLSSDDVHLSYLMLAEVQFRLGNHVEVENLYRELLKGTPSSQRSTQAMSGLVSSLAYQKKWDASATELDALMVRFGEDRDVIRYGMLARAHVSWNKKDYKEAAKKYQKFHEMFPGHSDEPLVLYQWGRALSQSEPKEKSLTVWAQLRKDYPDSPYSYKSLLLSAAVADNLGQPDKAQNLYRLATRHANTPHEEEALKKLAQSQLRSNHVVEALHTYDLLSKRFPNSAKDPIVQKKIQETYQLIARLQPKQLDPLQSIYRTSVHAGEGLFQVGIKFYEKKKWGRAIEKFDHVVTKYPHTPSAPDALFYRGESEYKQKEYRKALGTLRQFSLNNPDHSLVYWAELLRGKALWRAGYSDEATTVFKGITKKTPGSQFSSAAYLNWARVKEQEQQYAQQRRVYQVFLKKFPGHPQSNRVTFGVGDLLKREGKYHQALAYYKKVKPNESSISERELDRKIRQLEDLIKENEGKK